MSSTTVVVHCMCDVLSFVILLCWLTPPLQMGCVAVHDARCALPTAPEGARHVPFRSQQRFTAGGAA